jgi:preprotein translocase subunit Sec63
LFFATQELLVETTNCDLIFESEKMSKMRCHYEVLGVARDADQEELKKSYRKMALKVRLYRPALPTSGSGFRPVT